MTRERAPEPSPASTIEATEHAEPSARAGHLESLLDTVEASAPFVESVESFERPDVREVREVYGTVAAVRAGLFSVRVGRPGAAGAREIQARRAVSCLVEPEVGDRVLCAVSEESFVLMVLVKGEAGAVTISAEGDVTVRSRGGKLAIAASKAVTLTSGERVEVTAPELEVRAMKTSFFSATLSYVGRTLDGEVDRIRLAAQSVDRAIDRVTERIKQSFRTIDEVERVKAKELDVDVEGNFTVHADSTLLSSEKLVKVDGEQIHLG